VSKRVNSTRTDDEDAILIDEVPPDQEKPRLLL
jgi:hypothetical protein